MLRVNAVAVHGPWPYGGREPITLGESLSLNTLKKIIFDEGAKDSKVEQEENIIHSGLRSFRECN